MILAEYLSRTYREVYFDEFYREIFQEGYLPEWTSENPRVDYPSDPSTGKWHYVGIAMEQLPECWPANDDKPPKHKIRRHYVYDDLTAIHELVEDEKHKGNFIFMPLVSYVGHRRLNANARQMFALVIEVDNLVVKGGKQEGLRSLLLDVEQNYIPHPTYILCSGHGVHLYYVFEKPINLYPSIFKQLHKMKRELTKRIWNRRVTTAHDSIQYESICQPFRMLGTVTKRGEITRAFEIGEKVNIDYLNEFVKETNQVFLHYEKYQRAAGITPLAVAAKKWPDWYERVPARQKAGEKPERRYWQTNRGLYDRFLERIPYEARAGHRYNCLRVLGACALKSGISFEEYEEDCWRLLPELDFDPEKPFTEQDIYAVLEMYESEDDIRMTIEAAAALSGMEIRRAKRNGRKRNMHVKIITATRDIMYPDGSWREGNGRPKGSGTAQQTVLEWRKNNPGGRKADCIRATGLTKPTVYKWWDSGAEK